MSAIVPGPRYRVLDTEGLEDAISCGMERLERNNSYDRVDDFKSLDKVVLFINIVQAPCPVTGLANNGRTCSGLGVSLD